MPPARKPLRSLPPTRNLVAPDGPSPPPSAFQSHCSRWRDGCGAGICGKARRKCFARGKLPCDILLVGEAPGPSEDVSGLPFVGPAGHLLDHILTRAKVTPKHRVAFTNLVLCIPRDEEGNKDLNPDPESVAQCAERLTEFIEIAEPRLVVAVGAVARDYLIKRGFMHSVRLPAGTATADIEHPASILRANVAQKEFKVHRACITLESAVEEALGGDE